MFFLREYRPVAFPGVTKEKSFTLEMNRSITIRVDGANLKPGGHKLEMGFDVPGLGTLRFDLTAGGGDG